MNTHRSLPNILLCGPPGVGKSTLANLLEEDTELNWIDVNKVAIDSGYVSEYDEELQCSIFDGNTLVKLMEDWMRKGGQIVDYRTADLFPPSWFDAVFVLKANNATLDDRLHKRRKTERKTKNKPDSNLGAEIFVIVIHETQESFNPEIVYELTNNVPEDMPINVDRILEWMEEWIKDNM
ncbi:Adenylate kinase isoenzyme 6 [Atta colombica]|uniref:Adenylate kinase isoenzyme 6 homolog n=1 Tax=Atta colombica TaxID=520822 RepID=A0A195B909_9HYME|nr:PREDICTED: adenylate kinase isoenzyme 6-like [Atta colombica]KYM81021.1 Adenylate kinase isoenzyme 6 [Atta colombica]